MNIVTQVSEQMAGDLPRKFGTMIGLEQPGQDSETRRALDNMILSELKPFFEDRVAGGPAYAVSELCIASGVAPEVIAEKLDHNPNFIEMLGVRSGKFLEINALRHGKQDAEQLKGIADAFANAEREYRKTESTVQQ